MNDWQSLMQRQVITGADIEKLKLEGGIAGKKMLKTVEELTVQLPYFNTLPTIL